MPEAFQKLGRYLLAEEIASGGMAVVYRARFVGVAGFEKEFAVKKILPHWSHDPEFARMLIDEAKVLVKLHHPNIVQVFELGLDAGSYFIVMEFVDGFDLRAVLRRLNRAGRKLPLKILCHVAKRISSALEFAHGRKDPDGRPLAIVHRDVSPQNVLLSREGQVKLTDFGIAKMTGRTATTRAGTLKGKYAYMSPEQASGGEIDQRSDIFSLGSLLYEMAVGLKCFEGASDLATLENVKRAAVSLPEGLHPQLARLITRALAAGKNDRYRDVSELRRDLQALENDLPRRADADDLREFLAELMGGAAAEDPFFNRDTTAHSDFDPEALTSVTTPETGRADLTRALPNHDAALTQLPSDAYTIVAGETESEELTEKKNPAPPASRQDVPFWRIHAIKMASHPLMILVICLTLLTLAASYFFTPADARNHDAVHDASAPSSAASKASLHGAQLNAAILKPRHEFLNSGRLASVGASAAGAKFPPTQQILSLPMTTLKPSSVHVLITADPPESELQAEFDGHIVVAIGTLKKNFEWDGKAESLAITAKLAGYEPVDLALPVEGDHPEIVQTIRLEKIRNATITVDARPWGVAQIVGRGNLETPAKFTLPAGSYTLKVSLPPEKTSVTRTLQVAAGENLTCRASFAKKKSLSCFR